MNFRLGTFPNLNAYRDLDIRMEITLFIVEEFSINVKYFVDLRDVLSESLAFSFRFISFNNMTDELDFDG